MKRTNQLVIAVFVISAFGSTGAASAQNKKLFDLASKKFEERVREALHYSDMSRVDMELIGWRKIKGSILERSDLTEEDFGALAEELNDSPGYEGLYDLIGGSSRRFFMDVGANLFSRVPWVNSLDFSGLLSEIYCDEVSEMFRIANEVGLSREWLDSSYSWIFDSSKGAENQSFWHHFSSFPGDILNQSEVIFFKRRVGSLRKRLDSINSESDVTDIRVMLGLLPQQFEAKRALGRLYKALAELNAEVGSFINGYFNGQLLAIAQDRVGFINGYFNGQLLAIAQDRVGLRESNDMERVIDLVCDLFETIILVYGTTKEKDQKEIMQLAAVALDNLFLALVSDDEKKYLDSAKKTVEKILPDVGRKLNRNDDSMRGTLLQRVFDLDLKAQVSLVPLLVRIINKLSFGEPSLVAFLPILIDSAIAIITNPGGKSLIALADWLISVNEDIDNDESLQVFVFKSLLTIKLEFGIEFQLQKWMFPDFSEKKITLFERIISLLPRFGRRQCYDSFLDLDVSLASEDQMEMAYKFLLNFNGSPRKNFSISSAVVLKEFFKKPSHSHFSRFAISHASSNTEFSELQWKMNILRNRFFIQLAPKNEVYIRLVARARSKELSDFYKNLNEIVTRLSLLGNDKLFISTGESLLAIMESLIGNDEISEDEKNNFFLYFRNIFGSVEKISSSDSPLREVHLNNHLELLSENHTLI